MDEIKNIPVAFVRTNKKQNPKGVININRKKPRIEKYDDNLPVFSYSFTPITEQQIEMPPTEE